MVQEFPSHEKWMREAIRLAHEASRRDEVPIGALLVWNNEILGRGYNLRETTHKTTAHAELIALDDFNTAASTWRLPPGTTLYVTAEPCLMCTGAMIWSRLDNLVFGCSDPRNAGLLRIADMIADGVYDHRFASVEGGILKEECAAILKGYFQSKR